MRLQLRGVGRLLIASRHHGNGCLPLVQRDLAVAVRVHHPKRSRSVVRSHAMRFREIGQLLRIDRASPVGIHLVEVCLLNRRVAPILALALLALVLAVALAVVLVVSVARLACELLEQKAEPVRLQGGGVASRLLVLQEGDSAVVALLRCRRVLPRLSGGQLLVRLQLLLQLLLVGTGASDLLMRPGHLGLGLDLLRQLLQRAALVVRVQLRGVGRLLIAFLTRVNGRLPLVQRDLAVVVLVHQVKHVLSLVRSHTMRLRDNGQLVRIDRS